MTAEELQARLKAFALMLRFGHDLFGAKDFDAAATMAASNARGILNFTTSTLVEVREGVVTVLAQYGQPLVNAHSALAEETRDAVLAWLASANPEADNRAGKNFFVRLPLPANTAGADFTFVWVLEYDGEMPRYVPDTAKMLAASVGEGLCYQRLCKDRGFSVRRHLSRRWVWWLLALAAAAGMLVPVRESVTAEFSVVAPEVTAAYAWFDGPIAACRLQDGARVKAGDLVAEYETGAIAYRFEAAQSQLREIEAELALERQNAFADPERLGKVKLLEARRETAQVSVEEAKWHLDHAKLVAPADGVLSLADGRAELLTGKAVRTGDRLFSIMGGEGFVAEIPVNERDASLLGDELAAELFLHTAPDRRIAAEVTEVPSFPQLTEQKTYAYVVRAKMESGVDCRYGMRGIAKVYGSPRAFGWGMLKSAILWCRGL